jgi:inositol-1,3,4-trisphosphate 5/6-kinase / inositol-tetrakisphosphate 1-kinase
MDVILHKLTEDILCLSQLATERQGIRRGEALLDVHGVVEEEHQLAAVTRVQRLIDFKRDHPECSLVDSPLAVQTLMSRADIAVTLQSCLLTVTTASGVPVGSPAYAVIGKQQGNAATIEKQVADLSFPIIVKPLTAAGTKASHAMAVLLDRTALLRVIPKVPCLCQEYSNHDAVLYKVYVLGDHVSVHKRRSLPNLPKNQTSTLNYVEFDSQRPYPRLSEFGFPEDLEEIKEGNRIPGARKRPRNNGLPVAAIPCKPAAVTAEEVKPIVDALKEAFGLELFGFDILITPEKEGQRRMVVVDVNYFPSYKEVPNFPALLAKYLTDRAIESRRMASTARATKATAPGERLGLTSTTTTSREH